MKSEKDHQLGKKPAYIKLVIVLGILALMIPLFNSYFSYRSGSFINKYINWLTNFIMLLAAYLLRFTIYPWHPNDGKKDFCCFQFIQLIFIAMNIGFIATITIYSFFLVGAFIYLVMHIFIILALLTLFL
ncbi:MAG: hypothetical protein MJB14_15470, partial [Spirochaetes bacterium]|nr:hypothetical protein [Spirochaetota bacterium]